MLNIPNLLDVVHKIVSITCGVLVLYKTMAKLSAKKSKTKRNAKKDVPKS